jgi:hypothetical protein
MDTLTIKEKYVEGIEEWVGSNKSLLIEGGFLHGDVPLPLNDFKLTIIYENVDVDLWVSVKGTTFKDIVIKLLDDKGSALSTYIISDFITKEVEEGIFNFGFQLDDSVLRTPHYLLSTEEKKAEIVSAGQQSCSLIIEIMIYLMFHKQELVLEKKVVNSGGKKSKKKSKSKRSNKKTYLEHHYRLEGYEVGKRGSSGREFTRHTESWTVRGHLRKLPNGKVVYIKPYVKGTGKKKDKDYVL